MTVIGARSSPQDSQSRKVPTRLTVDPVVHTLTVTPAGNAGEKEKAAERESDWSQRSKKHLAFLIGGQC